MATDVFISYCRENAADAERICQFLEQNNVSCWIAPRNIPGGMEWPEAIVEGIKGSRAMLVLLSANTQRSKQIGRELTLASDHELIVITVRLDEVPAPDRLQYFTSNLQWIDVFGDRFEDGMAKLLATLRYQLGKPQVPIAPKTRFSQSTQTAQVKKSGSKGRKIAIGAVLALLVLGIIGYFADESNRAAHGAGAAAVSAAQDVEPYPARDRKRSPAVESNSAQNSAEDLGDATEGTWTGGYVCGGVQNQAQLTLISEGDGAMHGVLQFNALPQPGSYNVRGNVNPADSSLFLKYVNWNYRPPGNWIPLDISAQVDIANGVMLGRLQSGMCTTFELHKTR
jgi:hypothetical protein